MTNMQLTKQEQAMLDGKEGYAVRKSMEILVALGEIFGAKSLIKVGSVQVAGVSYHNLGDAGLEFLNELAVDGRVRVLTTLEPRRDGLGKLAATRHKPRIRRKTKPRNRRLQTHGHPNQLHLHTLPDRQFAALRRTPCMVRKQRRHIRKLSFRRKNQP